MDQAIRDLEDKHNEHKKIIEKNDGQTHFDRVMAIEKQDSGYHSRLYGSTVAAGQRNAASFMNKVHDHTHPDHGDALTAYRDKYNSSPENVEKDYVNKALKLTGAISNYLPNQAYENSVLSSYTVRTPEDEGFLKKFKDYMKTKWDAVGYAGDADFYKDFWAVHPMSTPPRKTLTEDGRILPYVQHN